MRKLVIWFFTRYPFLNKEVLRTLNPDLAFEIEILARTKKEPLK